MVVAPCALAGVNVAPMTTNAATVQLVAVLRGERWSTLVIRCPVCCD
jgi:hypothetical protein